MGQKLSSRIKKGMTFLSVAQSNLSHIAVMKYMQSLQVSLSIMELLVVLI